MSTFSEYQEVGGELELICDCGNPNYFEVHEMMDNDEAENISCSECDKEIVFAVKTKMLVAVGTVVSGGKCDYKVGD